MILHEFWHGSSEAEKSSLQDRGVNGHDIIRRTSSPVLPPARAD
jgi:hypothetical protein